MSSTPLLVEENEIPRRRQKIRNHPGSKSRWWSYGVERAEGVGDRTRQRKE
jgi:hypothetical protein